MSRCQDHASVRRTSNSSAAQPSVPEAQLHGCRWESSQQLIGHTRSAAAQLLTPRQDGHHDAAGERAVGGPDDTQGCGAGAERGAGERGVRRLLVAMRGRARQRRQAAGSAAASRADPQERAGCQGGRAPLALPGPLKPCLADPPAPGSERPLRTRRVSICASSMVVCGVMYTTTPWMRPSPGLGAIHLVSSRSRKRRGGEAHVEAGTMRRRQGRASRS